MESLLTTDEVAAYLKLDGAAVLRLVSRGELAAYEVGGEYRFARADLQAFLERRHSVVSPPAPLAYVELPDALAARDIERLAPGLSQRARAALALARAECAAAGYLGTEHLLLGLISEGSGIAAQVLDELGIAPDAVRRALDERVQWPERPAAPTSEPQATDMARAALQYALAYGAERSDAVIGTEHMLYGLSKSLGSNSALLLELLGTTCDTVEAEVLRRIGRAPGG